LAQKFPEDETLFDRVLNELFKENRLEQAEAINQRFLKEFPNFETPLIYQGNFVLSRGDTLKALSVYEKALDINPSYIELDDYVNRLYLQIAVKRNDKQ
jgi:tetratricopeptide (TPR) repeat protein